MCIGVSFDLLYGATQHLVKEMFTNLHIALFGCIIISSENRGSFGRHEILSPSYITLRRRKREGVRRREDCREREREREGERQRKKVRGSEREREREGERKKREK